MPILIRPMEQSDIESLTDLLADRWHVRSTRKQYERYWQEHQSGQRVTLIALVEERIAGYVNVLWQAQYEPFEQADIPEINDLMVLSEFRKVGVGTQLMHTVERWIAESGHSVVGLGCGISAYYGAAQRLYPRLGYIPDGQGAQKTPWGLMIYMTKQLSQDSH